MTCTMASTHLSVATTKFNFQPHCSHIAQLQCSISHPVIWYIPSSYAYALYFHFNPYRAIQNSSQGIPECRLGLVAPHCIVLPPKARNAAALLMGVGCRLWLPAAGDSRSQLGPATAASASGKKVGTTHGLSQALHYPLHSGKGLGSCLIPCPIV
jgi:hypothetical protein